MWQAFLQAFDLLGTFDDKVLNIVLVSLQVSVTALLIGCLIGLPLGAFIAVKKFRGRQIIVVILNSLMGVPTVIVGVVIYLLLSRSGPLGSLGWLFTAKGMTLAQVLLTTPLIAALTRQIIEDGYTTHGDTFKALRLPTLAQLKWLVWDCRFSLSEVGAVMIVGGNIDRSTRTMTTAIALETSKGDLPLALSLGIVLLLIVLIANTLTSWLKSIAERRYG
jgi:tungstate transport system permease protein